MVNFIVRTTYRVSIAYPNLKVSGKTKIHFFCRLCKLYFHFPEVIYIIFLPIWKLEMHFFDPIIVEQKAQQNGDRPASTGSCAEA